MFRFLTLLFWFFSLTFGREISDFLFHLPECLKVSFIQKQEFEDSVDIYSGVLIVNGTKKEILYLTQPPFKVVYDGTYIRMGYEGEDFQTFDAKDYPNPILDILLNIDNLRKVFKVKRCSSNWCILEPKPPLNEYLEWVKVYFSNGRIEEITAEGGDYGKVEITVNGWIVCSLKR